MKNSNYYSYTIYGLLYLALFGFVGVFNFAFADWDPNVLQTAEYWVSTTTTSMIYLVAFQLTVNLALDVKKSKDETYLQIKSELDKQAIKGVKPTLRIFTDEINFQNKRVVWETIKNNKLTRLQNKTSEKVLSDVKNPVKIVKLKNKLAKLSLKNDSEWNKFKTNKVQSELKHIQDSHSRFKWRTRRYLKRRALLEKQLSHEWIVVNLRYVKLSYPQITPQEILTGALSPNKKTRIIDDSAASFALKKKLVLIVLLIGLNALMEAVIFTDSPFTMSQLRMLGFQIFMVFANIFSGWLSGVDAFNKKTMDALTTRQNYWIQFKLWEKEYESNNTTHNTDNI